MADRVAPGTAGRLAPAGRGQPGVRYLGPGRQDREVFVWDAERGTRTLGPLGRVGAETRSGTPLVAWDDGVLVVRDPSGRAIDSVGYSAAPGSRRAYISVTDPRVIAAYRAAWPNAGSPQQIAPLGSAPDPNFSGFAALVSGARGSHPSVVVFTNSHTFGFAAHGGSDVRFAWSQRGSRFLLTAERLNRRAHAMSGTISVGDAGTGQLRPVVHVDELEALPILNPPGTEFVYQTRQRGFPWAFVSVTKPGFPAFTVSRPPGFPWAWA